MLRAENIRKDSVEMATQLGFHKSPIQDFFHTRYEQAYINEMLHFINALYNGEMPKPTIEDGLKAQILADAATEGMGLGLVNLDYSAPENF